MEQELARVLNAYDLGALAAARRIERGHVDENWLVETERGRYFVKRRHPRRRQPHQTIQAQHDLIAHLLRSGFPAPNLIRTSAGQSLLVLDDEVYEVGEYIEGDFFDHDRPEHLAAAARMLGRYHLGVEGLARQALAKHGPLYSPRNARTALSRLREAWQVGAGPDLDPLWPVLQAQAHGLVARFHTHGPLPHLVIHGDYYAGNLLFAGDRIIGVVDYDKASWQPRVAELAEALIYFASPRPAHLQHLVYPGVLEWEPLARFLRGYAQFIVLGDAEIKALPDYVACIWFTVSLRRLLEHHPKCPPEAREALEEVLLLSDWACTHASKVEGMARNPACGEEGQ